MNTIAILRLAELPDEEPSAPDMDPVDAYERSINELRAFPSLRDCTQERLDGLIVRHAESVQKLFRARITTINGRELYADLKQGYRLMAAGLLAIIRQSLDRVGTADPGARMSPTHYLAAADTALARFALYEQMHIDTGDLHADFVILKAARNLCQSARETSRQLADVLASSSPTQRDVRIAAAVRARNGTDSPLERQCALYADWMRATSEVGEVDPRDRRTLEYGVQGVAAEVFHQNESPMRIGPRLYEHDLTDDGSLTSPLPSSSGTSAVLPSGRRW